MIPLLALLLLGQVTGSASHLGAGDAGYAVTATETGFALEAHAESSLTGPHDPWAFAASGVSGEVDFALTESALVDIEGDFTKHGKWEADLPGADFGLELVGIPGFSLFVPAEFAGLLPISAGMVLGPGGYKLKFLVHAETPSGFCCDAEASSLLNLTVEQRLTRAAIEVAWPSTLALLLAGYLFGYIFVGWLPQP